MCTVTKIKACVKVNYIKVQPQAGYSYSDGPENLKLIVVHFGSGLRWTDRDSYF